MFWMFLLVVFLFNSVLSQQGIFDPSTFRQSSCTGRYDWTSWFDTNDPDSTQGDFEVTSHIQQLYPSIMCSSPTAIEAQTSFDTNPTTTGDVFKVTLKDGFLCLNQKIAAYRTKQCTDYKVRYCCPITTV